ncbi:response regulator [Piscinibacter sp.]|uniref:response regulator n=1 Tax=Piscinibacter sp. TaxID=1903157 RepID=UPI0039E419FD
MNAEPRLLIVDDEAELIEILQEYFGGLGYGVQAARNAAQAKVLLTQSPPDLAILDIRMPGEDGLSLARWMREHCPRTGIVMLTTAAEVIDRVVGLEMGADDYLGKPFDLRELLARVKSVLRRREAAGAQAEPVPPGQVMFGRCRLNLEARKLFDANGREMPITAMEFDLLRVLAERPNRVLNRDELMALAHHRGWEVFDRSIDLRIMRLRRKIEPDPEKPEVIKTVRGVGYMFVAP